MIIGGIPAPGGGTASVIGLTKANVIQLCREEVVLVHAEGIGLLVLVYAEDDATLEASVKLAAEMARADEAPTSGKGLS